MSEYRMAAAFVICLVCVSVGHSQDMLAQGKTLEGHQRIFVTVNISEGEEFKPLGIKESSVEKFLVKRLKSAGIDGVSGAADGATAMLCINLDFLVDKRIAFYPFTCTVSFQQVAMLLESKRKAMVTTWNAGRFGTLVSNKETSGALLRKMLTTMLNQFVIDHELANQPKKDPFESLDKMT